jgi:hypothetical protein
MISHLLFTDNSLILLQADKKNADCLANILNSYCASSGKKSVKPNQVFIFLVIPMWR